MRLSFAFAASIVGVGLFVVACTGDDPTFATVSDTDGGADGRVATNPNAITCGASKPCANGAACADGYCCDSACSGVCEACNVVGVEGTCSPKSGAPTHGTCTGDATGACAGSCDGINSAVCTYPKTLCGAAGSCAGGMVTVPATCAAGTCGTSRTEKCTLGCYQDGCLGVKQVAAGYYHACAVLTDGTVRCWGANGSGESGQGGTADVLNPTAVNGITTAVAVAAVFGTTCVVLADKTVTCFGSNDGGGLGTGATDNARHYVPQVVAGVTDVVAIGGSSAAHFCAISSAGMIKCWGSNGSGELGGGATSTAVAGPTTVCQPGVTGCVPSSGATSVAGGDDFTCAIFAGGKVACWGSNLSGQCGQPGAGPILQPTFVTGLTATSLIAGNRTTCTVSGGGAKCFGTGEAGRLGHGASTASSSIPLDVCTTADCTKLLTGVTSVSTYDTSACAAAGGAAKCWGTSESNGQFGDGTTGQALQTYAATTAVAANAVSVISSGAANFAIIDDGANRDLRCWGDNSQGHCGTGSASPGFFPTPTSPLW